MEGPARLVAPDPIGTDSSCTRSLLLLHDAIDEGASGDHVLAAIRCCVAAKGTLTGKYSR
jgi:hypothetical protein